MAIVQISKIQVRTGANVDLPQLDVGELGYSTDEGRLYIGNDPAEPLPTIDGKYVSEILTSTSSLDFSRLNGSDNASMNMTSVSSGELLGISVSGSIATVVNLGGDAGGIINLGDAGNIKVAGAGMVNGYVLASDGNGGLTWTTNGALRSVIRSIANSSGTALFTTQENHLFGTGTTASVADVQPSLVQGLLQALGVDGTNKFYVNRRSSNTFSLHTAANAIAGNINYDPLFASYTANSGSIVGMITPSGSQTPGGANTQVQFNDTGGAFGGSSSLTFNKTTNVLNIGGNITSGNANLGNVARANFFSGSFRGAVGNASTANSGTFTSVTATNVSATGFVKLPVYANNTARDTAIPTPTAGMMVLNGTTFQGYNGTAWVNLS